MWLCKAVVVDVVLGCTGGASDSESGSDAREYGDTERDAEDAIG